MSKNKYNSGFSLLELLLVVAVGAVLIVSGLVAYRVVSISAASKEAKTDILRLQQQIRLVYNDAIYTGVSASDAKLTAAFDGMRRSGSTILNPFLGAVILKSDRTNTFKIIYEKVPRGPCVDMLLLFTDDTSSTRALGANSGDDATLSPKNLTITQASGVCTNVNNRVVWEFY